MTRPLTRGVAALRLPFALLARLLRGVLRPLGADRRRRGMACFSRVRGPVCSVGIAGARTVAAVRADRAHRRGRTALAGSREEHRQEAAWHEATGHRGQLCRVACCGCGAGRGRHLRLLLGDGVELRRARSALGRSRSANVAGGSCADPGDRSAPGRRRALLHAGCDLRRQRRCLSRSRRPDRDAGRARAARYLYDPSDSAHDLQVTVSSTSPAVTYYDSGDGAGELPIRRAAELGLLRGRRPRQRRRPSTSATRRSTFTADLTIPTSSTTDYQGGPRRCTSPRTPPSPPTMQRSGRAAAARIARGTGAEMLKPFFRRRWTLRLTVVIGAAVGASMAALLAFSYFSATTTAEANTVAAATLPQGATPSVSVVGSDVQITFDTVSVDAPRSRATTCCATPATRRPRSRSAEPAASLTARSPAPTAPATAPGATPTHRSTTAGSVSRATSRTW